MIFIDPPDKPISFGLTIVSALPQLLSAIVGGSIGLIGAWLANRSTAERLRLQLQDDLAKQRKTEKQMRADQLYTMFTAWGKMVMGHYMLAVPALTGQIKFNELLDSQQKAIEAIRDKYEYERIEMLIFAYFPDLRFKFEAIAAQREILSQHTSTLRLRALRGEFKAQSPAPLLRDIEQFGNDCDELRRLIVIELQHLV